MPSGWPNVAVRSKRRPPRWARPAFPRSRRRQARMCSTAEYTRVVNVKGQDLRVRIRPAAGHGGGTPVLLCCGIGAGFEVLQPFVDALDLSIEVVRFDVPGVGGSPAGPVPYGLHGYAYLALRMLRQL